ncbi:MAG: 50S ribosomal protein L11 [Candidatus Woesearchaeota archaeon]
MADIEVLIEGGKATAAPPLGPALGPMGVNIGQVVADINKKTAEFKGMQVPVKVSINEKTKEYTISVGTPPASALIKQEANVKKGAGNPILEKIADLKIEQIIKIAIMKEDALLGKDLKMKVREIVGTCQSMGILVEGDNAQAALKRIEQGEFDKKISARRTEISAEDLKEMEEEKLRLQAELEEKREEYMEMAQERITSLEAEGKTRDEIKAALALTDIPTQIVEEALPEEEIPVAGAPTPE